MLPVPHRPDGLHCSCSPAQKSPTRVRAALARATFAALAALLVAPAVGVPAAGTLEAQDVSVNVFVAPGFNRMEDWSDGMLILRERARTLTREVGGFLDAGVGISYGAGVRWHATPRWAYGLEVERLSDELEIRLPAPVMHHYYDFYTATAASTVGRLVVRHVPFPEYPVALELAGGAGRGSLDWNTSGTRAKGAGWGPYLGASGSFTRRELGLHMAFTVGGRWHRIPTAYSDLTVLPPPEFCVENPGSSQCVVGLIPDLADLEAFLTGRDVDYSGFYLRLDLAWGL